MFKTQLKMAAILLSGSFCFAEQAPEIDWISFETDLASRAYDLVSHDEQLFILGEASAENGEFQAFLQLHDSEGGREWVQLYTSFEEARFYSGDVTADNNLILVGDTRVSSEDSWNIFWVEVNAAGEVINESILESNTVDQARSVAVIPEHAGGGFIIAGSVDNNFSVIRIDSTGEISWNSSIQMHSGYDGIASSIIPSIDGSFIVAGQSYHDNFEWTSRYHLICKMDLEGDTLWTHQNYDARLFAVCELENGDILATGEYQDAYMPIHRLTAAGEEIWYQQYGTASQNMMARDVIQSDDGNIVLCGRWQTGPGQMDAFLLKIDEDGEQLWLGDYDVCGIDIAYSLTQISDGSYCIAGGCTPANDAFCLKTLGENSSIASADLKDFVVQDFEIEVSPNPFNPSTTIRLSIANDEDLHIALYNLKGEMLSIIHSGLLRKGVTRFNVDFSNLNSGIYFVNASSPRYSKTVKLILSR
jgi:hypothetical protein